MSRRAPSAWLPFVCVLFVVPVPACRPGRDGPPTDGPAAAAVDASPRVLDAAPEPVDLATTLVGQPDNPHHIARLVVSDASACALKDDGSLWCWGSPPGMKPSPVARRVPASHRFDAIALGAFHVCGLVVGGGVSCWGLSEHGQTGDVRALRALVGAVDVAAGQWASGTLLRDGSVRIWGPRWNGIVGAIRGGIASQYTVAAEPSDPGLREVTSLVIGDQVCALYQGGAVTCWGGMDGSCSAPSLPFSPARIEGFTDAVEIAMNRYGVCARTSVGGLRCWRWPGGEGRERAGYVEVKATPVHDGVQLGAGGHDVWLRTRDGRLLSGNPLAEEHAWREVFRDVVDFAAAGLTLCARLQNGDVQCGEFLGAESKGIRRIAWADGR